VTGLAKKKEGKRDVCGKREDDTKKETSPNAGAGAEGNGLIH